MRLGPSARHDVSSTLTQKHEHDMNHTVLVVEDEEDLREMIRDALEMSGYKVETAHDGQEALDKIAHIDQLVKALAA